MNFNTSLPFISTTITLLFAGTVLNRYFKGRKPHSLLWGIGLLLYAAGPSLFPLQLFSLTGI